MRLIDADKLRLSYWIPSGTSTVSTAGQYYFYSRTEVDEAPTVDAEPIVRCRDCKYWSPGTAESIKDGTYINYPHPCEINCWGSKGEWRTADDFCSKGEKK